MRIVLADDQKPVRSALRLLLEEEPGRAVAGEAADATGLLRAAVDLQPDLVLLDWELPGLPPGELLRLLTLRFPALRIVAMSTDPGAEQEALGAGAAAFVSKNDSPQRLLLLLETLQSGVAP